MLFRSVDLPLADHGAGREPQRRARDVRGAQLARATIVGSGELARLSADPASKLRTDVTSPGGTTEAALKVLMADPGGLKELMTRAVEAAAARSKELSKS